MESTEDLGSYRFERVSFRAGYGNERVAAYVFDPRMGNPPYQTVVVFPGANWLHQNTSRFVRAGDATMGLPGEGGRAVVVPSAKGRWIAPAICTPIIPRRPASIATMSSCGPKISAAALDYVETRPDLDATRVAFYGFSWGGTMGAIIPALELRVKVVVLESGGL